MNLVNVLLILLIFIAVFEGIYRGFLHSALSLGALFLSTITSYIFYPVVSAAVKASPSLFKFLTYYTEGAEKIKNFENSSLLVNSLSPEKLNDIVSTSSAAEPFKALITQNVHTQAFGAQGLTTIGEYFNMTIVCAVLNILSFLLVFLIARVLFAFVLGAVNYTVQFPELKRYDRTIGALFGATRGVYICFLIVMVVPVLFLIMPVDKIIQYIQSSSLGMFFYNNNFLLHLIRGIV
jgi:uncharacterized membrane protein required for colicin V production